MLEYSALARAMSAARLAGCREARRRTQLTRALARLRASGVGGRRSDRVEPDTRGAALSRPISWRRSDSRRGLRYEPQPLGLPEAREAVAADQMRRGAAVDPDQRGADGQHQRGLRLAVQAAVRARRGRAGAASQLPALRLPGPRRGRRRRTPTACAFTAAGRWISPRWSPRRQHVRALVAVSPNNPTGSYLDARRGAGAPGVCRSARLGADRGRGVRGLSVGGAAALPEPTGRGRARC